MNQAQGVDAYPLQWPEGWKKTWGYNRSNSKFADKSFAVARDMLMNELKRFRAKAVILSTNIPLRKDGLPYSGYRQPDDPGVAVYFQLPQEWKNGRPAPDKPMVFACDKWRKIEENIYAIYKTIEALRGIERWGSSDLMERSFTGFQALPPAASQSQWWEVLGVPRTASADEIGTAWRNLMQIHHPDRGGDTYKAAQINQAYKEGMGARS